MRHTLHFVTGAPGAGKSTTVQAFAAFGTEYVAFDIDWLADTASVVLGKSIYTDASTWEPYSLLWFTVLKMIVMNGKTPVFFTPNDPSDIEKVGLPDWCSGVEWLLLDCDDAVRRSRLGRRAQWTDDMIDEAVADARELRGWIGRKIATDQRPPNEVAAAVLAWLKETT